MPKFHGFAGADSRASSDVVIYFLIASLRVSASRSTPEILPAATEIEGGNDGPSADSPGESGVFDNPDAQDDIDQMMKELADAISTTSMARLAAKR